MRRPSLLATARRLRAELHSFVCFVSRHRADPEEQRKQLESALVSLEETAWLEKSKKP